MQTVGNSPEQFIAFIKQAPCLVFLRSLLNRRAAITAIFV